MHRVSYLQWLAVVGVWAPVCLVIFLATLWVAAGALWPVSQAFSMAIHGTIAVLAPFVLFAFAHVLVTCGLLGGTLVLIRRAADPKLTIVSAATGLLLGIPVLLAVYFDS